MPDFKSVLVSAGDDVKVWDAERMQIIKQYNYQESNIKDVAWNHDNTILASTASNGESVLLCEPEIQDDEKPKIVGKLAKGEQQTAVCFGTRGRVMYSGGSTGDVNTWDLKTGKLKKHFNGGHQSPITCISVNIPETQAVSACTEGEMIVWDTTSGDVCTNLRVQKSQAIRGLDHSLQNEFLFGTASDDGSVRLWDIDRQMMLHEFTNAHLAPAMDLSFTPLNHLLLASCGLDKKFELYDISKKNIVKTYTGKQPWTTICFLPNGLHIAVGSSLGSIYKFDLRHLTEPLDSVAGHSTSVQRLIPQHGTKKAKERRSKNYVSSAARKQPAIVEPKSPNGTKKDGSDIDGKTKPTKKTSIDTNGNRFFNSAGGNSTKQFGVGDSKADLINGNIRISPGERRQLAQNNAPSENIALLTTPAVNKSHTSNRDTLGSYCEGVFSPVAPEYRGTPFTDDQEATNPDTGKKQYSKLNPYNGTNNPKSGETGSFINHAHDTGKNHLKPGRLSKKDDAKRREAWTPADKRGQPSAREGGEGRDSLGSYCEGIFSPVARDGSHRDAFPDVFGSRRSDAQKTREKETLVNGAYQEEERGKTRTRMQKTPGGLPFASHGGGLKVTPHLSKSRTLHPSSPRSYNTLHVKSTREKISSPSQSDSDSYHDSPPRSTKIDVPHDAGRALGGEAQGASGTDQATSLNPVQYQLDFLKNYVHGMMEHLVERHEDNVRDEIRHLHVQIIKMFAEQDEKIQRLAEQCSVNPILLQENERLRAENDRLRRKY